MRHSNRRQFLRYAAGLGLSAAALGSLSSACGLLPTRTPPRLPRLGYLSLGPREAYAAEVDAFLEGLRELGYVEGRTITIEWRFTSEGRDAAWAELATELVRLPVDLIVSISSSAASLAAKAATSTIPIVVTASAPVESGLVASLARPGGNVTGPGVPVGVNAKHLELLRSVVPGLTRAAAFVDTTNAANSPQWDEFRTAAEMAGVQPQLVDLHTPATWKKRLTSPSQAEPSR